MPRPPDQPPQRVRSLFVSDIHLGCRHAHVAEFLDFLNRYEPEQIFIIGDFIDWWKLRKSLAWQQQYNDIFARLYALSERGTQIFYTPGNHDAFLRLFTWNFPFVTIADEFVILLADGRRFLVTHGDKFDRVECAAGWISAVASVLYDGLLTVNRCWQVWQGSSTGSHYSLSSSVKRRVKQFVRYISDFERRLAEHARHLRCEGVLCGHIHTPVLTEIFGITYCNTGDWVENCTAFVEYDSGVLRMVRYFDESEEGSEPDDRELSPRFSRAESGVLPEHDRRHPETVTAPAMAPH